MSQIFYRIKTKFVHLFECNFQYDSIVHEMRNKFKKKIQTNSAFHASCTSSFGEIKRARSSHLVLLIDCQFKNFIQVDFTDACLDALIDKFFFFSTYNDEDAE